MNELLFLKKFLMCLHDLNKEKLLIKFFKKCHACLMTKLEQFSDKNNPFTFDKYISDSGMVIYEQKLIYSIKRKNANSINCSNILQRNCFVRESMIAALCKAVIEMNQECYGGEQKLDQCTQEATKWLKRQNRFRKNVTDVKNNSQMDKIQYKKDNINQIKMFDFQFQQLNQLFCNSNDTIESISILLKQYDEIYNLLFEYSMYLFKRKSKKVGKYFNFCLRLRPLNGNLHFRYSLYLCKILKNYKQALYHLKLSHRLNRNLHVFKNNNYYYKYLSFLLFKLRDSAMCGLNNCETKFYVHNQKWSVCGGCKSMYYCSKRCQKMDWTIKHKYNCMRKHVKPLTDYDQVMGQRMAFMLRQWS